MFQIMAISKTYENNTFVIMNSATLKQIQVRNNLEFFKSWYEFRTALGGK